MGDWKVLIADDLRGERYMLNNLLSKLRPDIERVRVANPAQAKLFFDQNRAQGSSLCIISDRDMSGPRYDNTDAGIPDLSDPNLSKMLFPDLVAFARAWQDETGNDVFIVRRSSDDAYSSVLNELPNWQKNNFDKPFLLVKNEPMQVDYLKAICAYCDTIFALR